MKVENPREQTMQNIGTNLAGQLWEKNLDWAHRILTHPFVQQLGEGTLPEESFRGYVAQDAYFLEAFARAYARALADSPDRQGLYTFADLIQGVLEELKLHAGYAERWNVDLSGVAPGPATLAYTEFLDQTARRGDPGLTCAAMTPCMRLYAFLGQSLDIEFPEARHRYAEWIKTYADPGFDALAGELESLLNRYASPSPSVEAAYRKAMELEWGFFDAHVG
jgi:thiaminase (transcriptional activator TenA)